MRSTAQGLFPLNLNTKANDLERETKAPEVSAVMPCLNESKTLETCIRKALAAFNAMGVDGEVVVADNGSTDGSQAIAERSGADFFFSFFIAERRNFGFIAEWSGLINCGILGAEQRNFGFTGDRSGLTNCGNIAERIFF